MHIEADPNEALFNPIMQAFHGPHTKQVAGMPGISPTFARACGTGTPTTSREPGLPETRTAASVMRARSAGSRRGSFGSSDRERSARRDDVDTLSLADKTFCCARPARATNVATTNAFNGTITERSRMREGGEAQFFRETMIGSVYVPGGVAGFPVQPSR